MSIYLYVHRENPHPQKPRGGARGSNCRGTAALANRRSWHSKILAPSIPFRGHLSRASLQNPSAGRSPGASSTGLLEAAAIASTPPCLHPSAGIGFSLAGRLRHAGLEGSCPAPTFVIDGEERFLAALEMTARRTAENRRNLLWRRQRQRCNRKSRLDRQNYLSMGYGWIAHREKRSRRSIRRRGK